MRLHRIRLKNYRGVADCAADFATQGVTIIEGDNEIGKTCIPEALNLSLSKLDSSENKQIRDVKPVHRDEGPEVEVELSSGPYQFTFFKRWLRQPQTTLNVSTPRREQLTGRVAHERVQAILEETLDQDLWRALRIEQGVPPSLPNFAVPSLGSALDQAAGGNVADRRETNLWDRIGEEREQYWTPTGRETKERKNLDDAVYAKQDDVEKLEERLQAVEKDAQDVAQLAQQERSLIADSKTSAENERTLSERWTAMERLQANVANRKSEHEAAAATHGQVVERHRRRQELVQDLRGKADELSNLEGQVRRATSGLGLAKQSKDEAENGLNAARAALRTAEDTLRLTNEDCDYHRNLIDRGRLSERFAQHQAAQKNLRTAIALVESSEVNDGLVVGIEEANFNVEMARTARDASAALVETTALSSLSVLIDGEKVELEAKTSRSSVVSDDWELAVPDVVQVRVRPGTESRDLAAEFITAQQEFERLCAKGGVSSLEEARQKEEGHRQAMQLREDARSAIEQSLGNLTIEQLAQKLDRLSASTAQYPNRRAEDPPLPKDLEDAEHAAAKAEEGVDDCRAEFERCEKKAEELRQTLSEAQTGAAVLREKITNARDAHDQATAKLATDRDKQSDSNLDIDLAAEKAKVGRAATALQEAEESLREEDPDSLRKLLQNARQDKSRIDEDLRNNQDRQRELAGKLDGIGEAGLHSQLSDAKSALAHLRREQERTEARAQAVRLLYETFSKHRQTARQRYVGPFKERIDQLGRIVFGPTFEAELRHDLKVERRTLDGITLDVDQLSIGAKEQLGVICRLACAATVSVKDGGAPVIIDDALGWSDPHRLQAMGVAIAAAGRECQVIVLTCTPGRYAVVGNAKVVRLRA